MKNYILFFLIVIYFICCNNIKDEKSTIEIKENNTFTFNLNDTLNSYKKPVLLYFMTDWCTGCKHVEKTYMKSEEFLSNVNQNFRFYKINGDLPYEFQLADTTYILQQKMNDFMLTFFEPSMMASYPSFMVIKENREVEAIVAPQFKRDFTEMADFLIAASQP